MLLVGGIEFDGRRHRLGKALRDSVDQPQPIESGDDHLRALILRHSSGVERDRSIGDDARHENGLAFEQSAHVCS